MPGHIDGIGLAHVVRAEFPPTRVVLMSSSAPDRATRDSVDGYFQKPFGLAEIREHFRRMLNRRSVVSGKSVSVRVYLGGRGKLKKTKELRQQKTQERISERRH